MATKQPDHEELDIGENQIPMSSDCGHPPWVWNIQRPHTMHCPVCHPWTREGDADDEK
jgi:hypothetical protein